MDQLNRVLYKELCVKLLNRYGSDPKTFDAFVMSGKEPFNAFLEVCQSVKFLSISDYWITVKFFDPNNRSVSFTGESKDAVKEYLYRNLLKHASSLQLDFNGYSPSDWILPYLKGLKHLDELDLSLAEQLSKTFSSQIFENVVSVKRLTADLDTFQMISKDFKLDKMTVKFREKETIEDLFKLSNFSTVELEIDHSRCEMRSSSRFVCTGSKKFFKNFTVVPNNDSFNSVKKLKFQGLSGLFFYKPAKFYETIKLIEKWFPKLEELKFDSGSRFICDSSLNGLDVKKIVDALHNCLEKYQGKLKLSMVYRSKFEVWPKRGNPSDDDDIENFSYYSSFNTSFAGYQKSSRYSSDSCDSEWKNKFFPATNVSLEVEIFLSEFEYEWESDSDEDMFSSYSDDDMTESSDDDY